jgi:hypothetical protein
VSKKPGLDPSDRELILDKGPNDARGSPRGVPLLERQSGPAVGYRADALSAKQLSAGHLLATRLLRVLTFSLVLLVVRVLRRLAAIGHGRSPLRDSTEKMKATVAFGYRVGHARRNCLSRRRSRHKKSAKPRPLPKPPPRGLQNSTWPTLRTRSAAPGDCLCRS